MSIDVEAMADIERLSELYKQHWGIPVDTIAIPPGMSQVQLAAVLNRIVDTGESILVGLNPRRFLFWVELHERYKKEPVALSVAIAQQTLTWLRLRQISPLVIIDIHRAL